jgi:hypothetical protein
VNITWKINTLDRRTSDGFVTTAHWIATAVDGNLSASVYATCGWSEGTPSVSYESLTEADVLAWVWESVDKAATEAALAAQIDSAKNPPVVQPALPWAA